MRFLRVNLTEMWDGAWVRYCNKLLINYLNMFELKQCVSDARMLWFCLFHVNRNLLFLSCCFIFPLRRCTWFNVSIVSRVFLSFPRIFNARHVILSEAFVYPFTSLYLFLKIILDYSLKSLVFNVYQFN